MEIELTPELEKAIQEQIDTGFYIDTSDFLRDALRHFFDNNN